MCWMQKWILHSACDVLIHLYLATETCFLFSCYFIIIADYFNVIDYIGSDYTHF